MSRVAFGRLVSLVTEKAEESSFKIGLEAIESGTGKLAEVPHAEYSGEGVAFESGDLLFGKLRPYLAKGWLADRPGAAVGDFHVYRCGPRLVPEYARWVVLANNFLDPVVSSVFGAKMPRASWGFVRTVEVHVPPLAEQIVIAEFIDRETAQIDTLIKEQQRLIEMLRERREVAIRTALLEGLKSDVGRRESGVDALGLIPEHWDLVPTRHLCLITTGAEDSGNANPDGGYPFFVRGREILRSDHFSFDGEAVMTPGDGQGGTGKVFHYFDGKFEAHQRVYVFTDFGSRMNGKYFYFFLSTFLRAVALAGSNTVTMESLRRPLLADFRVAVPPLSEQQQIVAYLEAQTTKIDRLIEEAERFIQLSQERRVALITAAVTGQVDVRGEVA